MSGEMQLATPAAIRVILNTFLTMMKADESADCRVRSRIWAGASFNGPKHRFANFALASPRPRLGALPSVQVQPV
jgi:hypothetical protein